ncbi:MAG: Replicative DNA helicase [Candidatus Nomurabacteria bacterium GW2011_GWF2_35_66]|uniref:Replicative DNA helicase n=1 Tax=Candidatus Nomurabacteria bacterium GW2011_GWE1_35_16 TaxID=1618761 RepID=A0A0G0BB37_9BACT|nr:MAG: Replicative DNA helicase [Candidatus Nomurabacteria bacterium GW2011_GWF1_34_20]KKP63372.1 MAG: Replicative DNA helicase [Candidatus Nomurabacteria bacterium GW2011_GWE2_34_25]KKP66564.1 MAG: Replicative DNA helicase [Candidatus Nomurabacteria bacterium GW2011_GWE1_35_16]KKP83610.1 MAG: Replicative DNA helicase [Candidatus Nomurabacteria bacterium GW2011_GWF2_35_66]HAE36870.1 replicative DNA helicase [Candidatus Nomurabacteria bacterium]
MSDKKTNIRIPPQSIDGEKAVLGSIMLRPSAIHEINDIINVDSFYVAKHSNIYKIMLELSSKGDPIDLLTVSNKLKEKGMLDSVGGNSYLTELSNSVPASTNIKYYADLVAQKHLLRKIIDAGGDISELGFTEEVENVFEILDQAEKRMMGINNNMSGHAFTSLKDSLPEAWERLEKLHESKGELRGVPTGFHDLDQYLSGLQKSDLIILAARPSMGKTTLALDIARQAAMNHGTPTVIFSLEMSTQQLVDRMLAAQSRVNAWNLRTGNLTAESEFAKIRDSLDSLSKAPIFVDDLAGNSIVRMRSVCRRIRAEHGIGLIIVDYLQLMSTSKNYDNMVNQVTEISRSLKSLAKEFDVPVLALSQLSRAVESRGGRPRLSDLRDSGSIEQDADIVMFIHREDKGKDESEKTNIAEILIEKHRNGPVGKVDLYFDEKTTTFVSIDKTGGHQYVPTGNSGGDMDQF